MWGPASGRRVLALHGWLDNSATWDRVAPLLPGLRIAALDLTGHGWSSHRPVGVGYHFIDWVGDVQRAADALGWERFSVLGHSMGGGIGALVAGTLPERVEALVGVEGLVALTAGEEFMPERLAKYLAARARLAHKTLPVYPSAEAALAARLRAGGAAGAAPAYADPAGIALVVARGLKEVAGGVTWRTDPQLTLPSPWRLSKAQVQAFLQRIACPVLYIHALGGMSIEPDLLASVPRLVQSFVRVDVPGGHHVHLDDPGPVAAQLRHFLSLG